MRHLEESTINEYLDGELSADQTRQVEVHLETCSGCRQSVAELQALFAALDEVTDVSLATDLSPRVMAQLRQERVSTSIWTQLALVAQSAVALLLLPGLWPELQTWFAGAVAVVSKSPLRQLPPDPLPWQQSIDQALQLLESLRSAAPIIDIATGQWALLLTAAFVAWLLGNRLLFTANSNGGSHG